MIIFIKANGSAVSVLPSPVYQGSALNGSLYLVAPFPNTNGATVKFTLPDGTTTVEYAMTAINELQDVLDAVGDNYSVWEWQTKNNAITALPGTVTAQFAIYFNGQIQTTSAVNFTVQEGVLPIPQDEPSANEWEAIIELLGNLAGRVTNLEKFSNQNLMDFTCQLVEIDGVNFYQFTKSYSNGTVIVFNVLASGFEDGAIIKDGIKIISFTDEGWSQEGGEYQLYFTPTQTGYNSNAYIVQLEKSSSDGGNTISDSVFIGSDGSLVITSNIAYGGKIKLIGGDIYSNSKNISDGEARGSLEQKSSTASAEYATALGYNNIANSEAEIVVGKFNNPNAEALFQVGNGTSNDNRNNIFEILKTGIARLECDLQLGKGEFPADEQNGATVSPENYNYKLKLFAPTANPNHGDSQWSVIDIDNPGIGNHKLKIGITGGTDTRNGQIEYYQGSGSGTTKLQFTPDGVSVSSPKAEVLSATRDGVGKVFQGFAYGSQTVAQIKAVWNDGGSGGLIIKKDGLYQASSSSDNEGVKLATVNDVGGKMYKHTLYFRVNYTEDQYPHTGEWEGIYSFTKSIFNDSATPLTYQQAIEFIGNIFTINNLGQFYIDTMRDNYQDTNWQGYSCTRCDSSAYNKVLIMFMRAGFIDTVTEV